MEKRKPPYRISHHRTLSSAAYANKNKTLSVKQAVLQKCFTKIRQPSNGKELSVKHRTSLFWLPKN